MKYVLDFTITMIDDVALTQYVGNACMQSGTALGHIYLLLGSSYCSTQWPVAAPALCMNVFLS